MNPAPAKLQFVSSLFASKIFWAQVIALAASIASAFGVHILDSQEAQQQAIGMADMLATMALRLWFPTGPVSLTAPLSVPASQDVPVGASVVHVAAPQDTVQATGVQPLAIGTQTVTVAPPPAFATTPASVTVTPN
jgi:hypothetical protein